MGRKILTGILCAAMALSLSGCILTRESAKDVTKNAIQAVQEFDLETLRSYSYNRTFDDTVENEEGIWALELMEKIASTLTYEIVSANEDEKAGTAKVAVNFTNVDMSVILFKLEQELYAELFRYAYLPEDELPTEEEIIAFITEKVETLMDRKGNKTVTRKIYLSLVLEDDEWKIDWSDNAIDAMFGGLYLLADSFATE